MIRQLRRRHVWFTGTVGMGAAVLLGAAVMVRRPLDIMATIPDALTEPTCEPSRLPLAPEAFREVRLAISTLPGAGDTGASVCLAFQDDPREPDLLAYWSPGAPLGNTLPGDARLLGPVGGTRPHWFRLPPDAQRGAGPEETGHLTVYSMAHARIYATGPLPRLAAGGPQ